MRTRASPSCYVKILPSCMREKVTHLVSITCLAWEANLHNVIWKRLTGASVLIPSKDQHFDPPMQPCSSAWVSCLVNLSIIPSDYYSLQMPDVLKNLGLEKWIWSQTISCFLMSHEKACSQICHVNLFVCEFMMAMILSWLPLFEVPILGCLWTMPWLILIQMTRAQPVSNNFFHFLWFSSYSSFLSVGSQFPSCFISCSSSSLLLSYPLCIIPLALIRALLVV